MKHFSPTDESSTPANSQYNNMRQPPASLMATGFLGARPGRIGSPVAAEWFRGFADDGSLSNRKLIAVPNYIPGSAVTPINGVTVASSVITINVNTTCGSASKYVTIQPMTERP